MPNTHSIYLSYTSDSERRANDLQNGLRGLGFHPTSGRDGDTCSSADGNLSRIRNSDAFIVIVGDETYRSPIVESEIMTARDAGLPIIAVRPNRASVSPQCLYGADVTWVHEFSIETISISIKAMLAQSLRRTVVGPQDSNIVDHRVNKSEQCILFIHGYSGDAHLTWGDFPRLLIEDSRLEDWDVRSFGYATSLMPDLTGLWRGDPDIPVVAQQLRTSLTNLPDYRGLVIIAHSMGGLVAQRAILDDETLRSRLTHLFLFGTPSNGLVKAWPFQNFLLRMLKRQVSSMGRTSPFISQLRTEWTTLSNGELPFKLAVVAGAEDEFVPVDSSLSPFPTSVQSVVSGDHLSMVKPMDASNPSVQLVIRGIVGAADPAGPWNASRVALERLEFHSVVDQLWDHRDAIDDAAAGDLALALDELHRREDAIHVLESRKKLNTDAYGILAGRYKRRWIADRRMADATRSLELYQQGFRLASSEGAHTQAYYLGINVAFLTLAYLHDIRRAREIAMQALRHAESVDRSSERASDRMWRYATEGEANLLLGNVGRAVECYELAIKGPPIPTPRQRDSMYNQALRIASELGDEVTADALVRCFQL